jgi:hypothetical protein
MKCALNGAIQAIGWSHRQMAADRPVLVPLSLLAPELSTDVAALAHQLGAEVIHDDVGIRCVTPSTARQLIAQRDAAEVARKAAFAADYAASSSWLPAMRAQLLRRIGRERSGNAMADLLASDIQARWDKTAADRNEMLASERSGRLNYHRLDEKADTP